MLSKPSTIPFRITSTYYEPYNQYGQIKMVVRESKSHFIRVGYSSSYLHNKPFVGFQFLAMNKILLLCNKCRELIRVIG